MILDILQTKPAFRAQDFIVIFSNIYTVYFDQIHHLLKAGYLRNIFRAMFVSVLFTISRR
jgi:hypothetical protein